MCDQWNLGHNQGIINWAKNTYYAKINAYDPSYEGVSLQDFVETDALINIYATEACLGSGQYK